MKVADLEVEDLRNVINSSIGTAIVQSESRIINILCDRMDEGFAQIRREMQDGFAGAALATENLATIIDRDYQELNKRLTRLEQRSA